MVNKTGFIMLCMFLFSCGDVEKGLVGMGTPFLIGKWESVGYYQEGSLVNEVGEVKFSLYADGIASFNGIKGKWAYADSILGIVRIEVPYNRYQVQIHELILKKGEESIGEMEHGFHHWVVKQTKRGGLAGAIHPTDK